MLSGLLTPNGGCNQIRRDALVVREFQEGGRTVQIQNTAAARSKSNVCSSVPLSDDALVKAVAAGNRSAMCTLYDRHNMRLYRFIFRIVPDAGRAKELVSEVFIDVWNQADRFEGRSQVSTWILSIAHFKAARHRRRDAELDETALERLPDSSENPEQAVLNKDCSAQVRACLAQMSRNHREIIDLVYYQDKSVEEAAKITHMPKNTVKTRIYYARKILGRLLSAHPDFDRFSGRQAA
jgi:RNA polymerase sigma-70 factor (ECF subfamily)